MRIHGELNENGDNNHGEMENYSSNPFYQNIHNTSYKNECFFSQLSLYFYFFTLLHSDDNCFIYDINYLLFAQTAFGRQSEARVLFVQE